MIRFQSSEGRTRELRPCRVVIFDGAAVLTAVKEWPGSGGASGEVGVPAILVGRCARRLFDQAAGTKECSAGAEPKNGKQGMMRMQVPAGRQRLPRPGSRSRAL